MSTPMTRTTLLTLFACYYRQILKQAASGILPQQETGRFIRVAKEEPPMAVNIRPSSSYAVGAFLHIGIEYYPITSDVDISTFNREAIEALLRRQLLLCSADRTAEDEKFFQELTSAQISGLEDMALLDSRSPLLRRLVLQAGELLLQDAGVSGLHGQVRLANQCLCQAIRFGKGAQELTQWASIGRRHRLLADTLLTALGEYGRGVTPQLRAARVQSMLSMLDSESSGDQLPQFTDLRLLLRGHPDKIAMVQQYASSLLQQTDERTANTSEIQLRVQTLLGIAPYLI